MASGRKGRKRGLYEIDSSARGTRVSESGGTGGAPAVRVVSATEAARSFSDLINRVCYRGETYIVERGGHPMCELSPVATRRFTGADFSAILPTLARPSEDFLKVVEEAIRRQASVDASPWEK
jgi:antitoxin (DNA-binding transcriptional repressor) of toxin-antitoxin stability system